MMDESTNKDFSGLTGGKLEKRESNEQKESEKTEDFPPAVFFFRFRVLDDRS